MPKSAGGRVRRSGSVPGGSVNAGGLRVWRTGAARPAGIAGGTRAFMQGLAQHEGARLAS